MRTDCSSGVSFSAVCSLPLASGRFCQFDPSHRGTGLGYSILFGAEYTFVGSMPRSMAAAAMNGLNVEPTWKPKLEPPIRLSTE